MDRPVEKSTKADPVKLCGGEASVLGRWMAYGTPTSASIPLHSRFEVSSLELEEKLYRDDEDVNMLELDARGEIAYPGGLNRDWWDVATSEENIVLHRSSRMMLAAGGGDREAGGRCLRLL
ncbi:MAG: hypothetical protein TREMPRED_000745 [Tremellales sp. Tagirdzhanova-0007]|nr:MAG: hypothetical protein TREMPRED_000745 [Tremellales sp. Tagirdzhanova-0007]